MNYSQRKATAQHSGRHLADVSLCGDHATLETYIPDEKRTDRYVRNFIQETHPTPCYKHITVLENCWLSIKNRIYVYWRYSIINSCYYYN